MILLPVRLVLSALFFAVVAIRPLRAVAIALAVSTVLVVQHRIDEGKPVLQDALEAAEAPMRAAAKATDMGSLISAVIDDADRAMP